MAMHASSDAAKAWIPARRATLDHPHANAAGWRACSSPGTLAPLSTIHTHTRGRHTPRGGARAARRATRAHGAPRGSRRRQAAAPSPARRAAAPRRARRAGTTAARPARRRAKPRAAATPPHAARLLLWSRADQDARPWAVRTIALVLYLAMPGHTLTHPRYTATTLGTSRAACYSTCATRTAPGSSTSWCGRPNR